MLSKSITTFATLASIATVHAAPMASSSSNLLSKLYGSSSPAGAPAAPTEAAGGDTTPFVYPLSNGFPASNLSKDAIAAIQAQAFGTIPNGPAPASLATDDITSLELIAFNEIFEVAFFTDLLYNVTNKVPGYEVSNDADYQQLVSTITAVQAQEELHAIFANSAVAAFGHPAIQGCAYNFPVSTLKDALSLAKLFTDVVLGVLPNIQSHFAANGDAALIPGVGSVIGQEGEQNGYYRTALGLVPSALPFLTASSRAFAFSALNQFFVVPGSCQASVSQINLPIFPALAVSPAQPNATTQTLTFSTSSDCSKAAALVYINQQNTPIVVDITQAGSGSVTANFPFNENLMNGLTIAALVSSKGPFADADAVAAATIAGPAFIEIN
jgi:hypothetical protein